MDYADYKTDVPYPNRPTKPAKPGMDATSADYRRYAAELEDYEVACAEHKNALNAYRTAQGALDDKFRADVIEEEGLTGHPLADVLWSKAYEDGRSAGYNEVALHFSGYYDIVKAHNDHVDGIKAVVRQLLNDLPVNRDWLDPQVETALRNIVKK